MAKAGPKKKELSVEITEKIVSRYLAYETAKEIGKDFGCSREFIAKVLRENGIEIRTFGGYVGSNSSKWIGCGQISGRFFGGIKDNAKKRNLIFDISLEYLWDLFLKQNRKCVYSGLLLTLPITSNKEDFKLATASVDRIDSSIGYIVGNVQWVHKNINEMKWNMTEGEFLYYCELIYNHRIGDKYNG